MAAEGWKFTVVVPSWTTHRIADENVVLYRVESRVQAPGADHPKTRSVLRRFSDFRRLHASLKAKMPALMKGKDAPSKRTLYRINSSVDQIERRRRDLEQWLWALLGDRQISCSRELAQFLELGAAAGQFGKHAGGALGSGAALEASTSSAPGSSAGDRDDASEAAEHSSNAGSDLTSAPANGAIPGTSAASSAGSGQLPELGQASRLGLQVERRPTVRRMLTELMERVDRAKSDLEDAVQTAECERHAREVMAERLVELESRLGGAGGAKEDTEGQMSKLAEELELERQGAALLEKELDEARRALAAAQVQASSAAAAAAGAGEAASAEAAEREAVMRSDMKVLAKEVKKLRKDNSQLAPQAAAAEERATAAEARAAAAEARLAALERQQLTDAAAAANAAGNGQDLLSAEACRSVVALVDSVRARMALCDLEKMAEDEQEGDVEGDDLVATSNNRIAALLAEVQLLRRSPDGQAQSPSLAALQHSVADVLTDVGLLRQQLNNSPHMAHTLVPSKSRRSTADSLLNGNGA
eukprot:jgi/Tetstr1/457546/TSEL_044115.t1